MSDPDFQHVFVRLRDADREQAPSFAAMRARALARAGAETSPGLGWPSARLAALAATAVAIAVGAAVWIGTYRSGERPGEIARLSETPRVEQLMAAIDAHLAARLALSDWESPTDFLLPQEPPTPDSPTTP